MPRNDTRVTFRLTIMSRLPVSAQSFAASIPGAWLLSEHRQSRWHGHCLSASLDSLSEVALGADPTNYPRFGDVAKRQSEATSRALNPGRLAQSACRELAQSRHASMVEHCSEVRRSRCILVVPMRANASEAASRAERERKLEANHLHASRLRPFARLPGEFLS
jgi:hypothetical protein